MTCPNCNNNNIDQAKFCAYCGATLSAKKQPPPFPGEGLYEGQRHIDDVVNRPGVITLLAVLQYAACVIMFMGFVGFIFYATKEQKGIFYFVAFGMLIFTVIHFFAGYGLWNLRSYGRTIQLILAYLGLLSIPIGTIISILILVYLSKPEVKLLFSGKSALELQPHEIQLLQKFKKPGISGAGAAGVGVIIAAVVFLGIAIIGIIAAIAIPNLLNAIQRAKQKRTMADMRSIAAACEAYAVDHQKYPEADSINKLKSLLVPEYVKILPEKDGWERAFEYQAWKADESQEGPTSYMIVSLGKDGTADANNYYEGMVTSSFNNDIVFSDGTFWQYPEYSQP